MSKQVMVCGVDCHQGDENCNLYCIGKSDSPPEATEEQVLDRAAAAAYKALMAAEKAWHDYACLCDVGPDRARSFAVFDAIRCATRIL